MSKPPSKSVFVGNIPYGLTEEQIVDIFNSAGNVVNFRLVYDRETGRPKGFGFAEYPDSARHVRKAMGIFCYTADNFAFVDSAASAVRNLNDYEIMNRKLRVDFSNDGVFASNVPTSTTTYKRAANSPSIPSNASCGFLPTTPTCRCRSSTESYVPGRYIADFNQLLDVLSQMKTLASTDPQKATELLHQAPQLSYAIFQALLLMGLVQPEALTSVIESSAVAPAPAPAVNVPPPVVAPTAQYGGSGYPAGYPPPPPHMAGQMGMPIMSATPVQGYAPPPPPPVQQPVQQPEPDANALMAQVMAMPQELIDSLPPADRAQLMALKASFGR
ncbi:hypothetical protein CJF30_00004358 [Rutstroemia sp. NJR-2017a BBW]|nr:hypothetical protein CJF30_00004358 [Rutstroemia sp. NJR-2017a BBW]